MGIVKKLLGFQMEQRKVRGGKSQVKDQPDLGPIDEKEFAQSRVDTRR